MFFHTAFTQHRTVAVTLIVKHLDFFPVDVSHVPYHVGQRSAGQIIADRFVVPGYTGKIAQVLGQIGYRLEVHAAFELNRLVEVIKLGGHFFLYLLHRDTQTRSDSREKLVPFFGRYFRRNQVHGEGVLVHYEREIVMAIKYLSPLSGNRKLPAGNSPRSAFKLPAANYLQIEQLTEKKQKSKGYQDAERDGAGFDLNRRTLGFHNRSLSRGRSGFTSPRAAKRNGAKTAL